MSALREVSEEFSLKQLIARGAPIVNHASAAVIVRPKPDGRVLVADMTYDRTTIRHIMETGEMGETALQTLTAGIISEGAMDPERPALSITYRSPEPVAVRLIPAKRHPGCLHLQTAWVVMLDGPLRNYIKIDAGDELGPISMTEIVAYMRKAKGKQPMLHSMATPAALAHLGAINKLVCDRYLEEIQWHNPQQLTPEELAVIAAYPGKW